jgi:hypothetical protein
MDLTIRQIHGRPESGGEDTTSPAQAPGVTLET